MFIRRSSYVDGYLTLKGKVELLETRVKTLLQDKAVETLAKWNLSWRPGTKVIIASEDIKLSRGDAMALIQTAIPEAVMGYPWSLPGVPILETGWSLIKGGGLWE